MTSKPTNPKDVVGVRKVPFSTIPANVTAEVGLAMLEGTCKYGRHNYRATGVRASVYYDGTMRHLTAWWEGENIDPDSRASLSHITKAIAGLTVLRDAMLRGNWEDDRPPASGPFMRSLNDAAGVIIDEHADKKPVHYTNSNLPPEAPRAAPWEFVTKPSEAPPMPPAPPWVPAGHVGRWGSARYNKAGQTDDKFGAGPVPEKPAPVVTKLHEPVKSENPHAEINLHLKVGLRGESDTLHVVGGLWEGRELYIKGGMSGTPRRIYTVVRQVDSLHDTWVFRRWDGRDLTVHVDPGTGQVSITHKDSEG